MTDDEMTQHVREVVNSAPPLPDTVIVMLKAARDENTQRQKEAA